MALLVPLDRECHDGSLSLSVRDVLRVLRQL
jgi:hypothetical protein